jgi:hypothetical protein
LFTGVYKTPYTKASSYPFSSSTLILFIYLLIYLFSLHPPLLYQLNPALPRFALVIHPAQFHGQSPDGRNSLVTKRRELPTLYKLLWFSIAYSLQSYFTVKKPAINEGAKVHTRGLYPITNYMRRFTPALNLQSPSAFLAIV